jgi:hypothetical protein
MISVGGIIVFFFIFFRCRRHRRLLLYQAERSGTATAPAANVRAGKRRSAHSVPSNDERQARRIFAEVSFDALVMMVLVEM